MLDTQTLAVDKEIDARGSFCPGPLMELIRGMKTLPIGGTLAVLSRRSWVAQRHSCLACEGWA